MQKMGFTALTLNSTRTPTSSVTLPRAGDGARRCGFTFNYARYLRANVHRRGGYEAINGFCRWLNAQAEQRHLISAKAVCSIMFPALWTLFLLPNEEGEYSTRGRKISMDWVLHIKYIYCICIIRGFFLHCTLRFALPKCNNFTSLNDRWNVTKHSDQGGFHPRFLLQGVEVTPPHNSFPWSEPVEQGEFKEGLQGLLMLLVPPGARGQRVRCQRLRKALVTKDEA